MCFTRLRVSDFSVNVKRIIVMLLFSSVFISPTEVQSQFLIADNNLTVQRTGDVILFALPASALATTFIIKDREGTWQMTKGFLLNQAVTVTMKVLINKERPFQGGDYAFPSGHTSTTFQAASFFHKRYGFKYSIPGYLLAGFTGFSRINAQKHDGYDVLAGAVVGIGSTLFFTREYQEERMEFTFASSEDGWLLGFRYAF